MMRILAHRILVRIKLVNRQNIQCGAWHIVSFKC